MNIFTYKRKEWINISKNNFKYENIEENINKKNNNVIIILCIIIILLLCLLGYKVGKLGCSTTPTAGDVTEGKLDIIIVKDENGTEFSSQSANLNIFNNTAFDGEKIIAPHSMGTYQFYIKNEMGNDITFNIRFLDEMNHFVNMKYKLKINNVYVCGDKSSYVNLSELNLDEIILMKNSSMLFTLEWYWEDNDELDTIAGTQSNYEKEYYTLRINLQAFNKGR